MASTSSLPLLLLFLLLLLRTPLPSLSSLHHTKLLRTLEFPEIPQQQQVPLTRYFEVTKPIELPNTKPCSLLVLQHDFGFTYGKPPVTATYAPPTDCPSQNFSKIVMEWTATSAGRQFDRIFGVWLGGVELLRSCTAEPRKTGTVWTVEKDITRYSPVLKTPQTLAVYLGNLVNNVYTGIYHVNLTFHFYPAEKGSNEFHRLNSGESGNRVDNHADLIVPISRNLPLNDGLWFIVKNTETQLKEFSVPNNTYRAVLEVFVSFHDQDEFWYGNPPNEYIAANNLSIYGNGPFREVVVSLDDDDVGAVWPFTVIFTGGINPLMWRPITGIGSYDLPTYDIEITPFLGNILDGKTHKFGFGVTNGLSEWFIDANLHLWLDHRSSRTEGHLIEHKAEPAKQSLISNFKGLNGTFLTSANRVISSTGWVKSSHGKVTTHAFQGFKFLNKMMYERDGNLQIVKQTIDSNFSVDAKLPSVDMQSTQVHQKFGLHLHSGFNDNGNGSFVEIDNVSLSYDEEKFTGGHFGFSYSSLNNLQHGLGQMIVKNNLVVSGLGSTHQVYRYNSNEDCYHRNVSANNYTILYDDSSKLCSKGSSENTGFGFGSTLPFTARRASLASDLKVLSI